MITKKPRNGKDGYYDLRVTDKNGKTFLITVGGNMDLFWIPENQKEDRLFEIDKGDEITFTVFKQLFDAVEKNDDKYSPVLKDNVITFISEDMHEDEANVLNITKLDDSYSIRFNVNENKEAWTYFHRSSAICFCNSGSRVPRVEQLFMRMFNYLAYQCELIECETSESEM